MRDHLRTLGTLFIAWAAAQLVVAGLTLFAFSPPGAAPPLFWIVSALSVGAYGWVGYLLRQHAPSVRFSAILLSALALFSFPVGTVVGGYGLWVLLFRQRATHTAT